MPFDEGSLTGTLTRGLDVAGGRLAEPVLQPRATSTATLARVDRLRPLVPEGMDLPELALRFILEHPAVSTTIPGHAPAAHVERNLAASDGEPGCRRGFGEALKAHRWDRASERDAVGRSGRHGRSRSCLRCYNGGFPETPRSSL